MGFPEGLFLEAPGFWAPFLLPGARTGFVLLKNLLLRLVPEFWSRGTSLSSEKDL